MTVAGIEPRAVFRLLREAQADHEPLGPIVVVGPLAAHLARSLADGGAERLVRTDRGVAGASALVCIVGSTVKPDQHAQLRAATREGVAIVAVLSGPPDVRVPYVLPHAVVRCRPGEGFPLTDIAAALVGELGDEAPGLAAALPVLRVPTERALTVRSSVRAAVFALLPRGVTRQLPVLTLEQARLQRRLAVVRGGTAPAALEDAARTVAPELGASLVAGVLSRAVVRRLPRSRLTDAAVAGGVTFGLATVTARLRS